ncbi:MAG: DUF4352 domain-containing protein [Candidatus Diapherotrites archaeon]
MFPENSFSSPQETEGYFVILDVAVKNVGLDAINGYNAGNIKLIDKKTRVYESSSIGINTFVGFENAKDFFLEKINPGLSEKGTLFFEVPEDFFSKGAAGDFSAEGFIAVESLGKSESVFVKFPDNLDLGAANNVEASANANITSIEYTWYGSSSGGYIKKINFKITNTGGTVINLGLKYRIIDVSVKSNDPPLIAEGQDSWFDSKSMNSWDAIKPQEESEAYLVQWYPTVKAGKYKFELTFFDKTSGKELTKTEKEQQIP